MPQAERDAESGVRPGPRGRSPSERRLGTARARCYSAPVSDHCRRLEASQRRIFVVSANACGVTDIGLVRGNNEDEFRLDRHADRLLLADGLGGLPAGEVAASIAVATAAEELAPTVVERLDAAAARGVLEDAFAAANHAVHQASVARPGCAGMATTLVAALVAESRLYVAHVGDVRAYLCRGGEASQLTADHTVAGELLAAGRVTPEELRHLPQRNELTRVLGDAGAAPPSFLDCEVGSDDVLVLCSDGLWEALAPEVLARMATEPSRSAEQRAIALVDRALAAGGRDNITVVLRDCIR